MILILNATSEYRVVFLYHFWITTIFQTNALFKTNKCHHGGPLRAEGPRQLPPLPPPLTPALSVESDLSIRCLLSPLISLDEHVWRLYRTPWKASGVVPKEKWAYALQRKSYILLESRWFEFFVTENFKNAATYLISRCRNEEQSVVSSKLAEMRHPVSSQLHHCM